MNYVEKRLSEAFGSDKIDGNASHNNTHVYTTSDN